MAFINCTKCHAELSDDREACPHCGTEIPAAEERQAEVAGSDREKVLLNQVIEFERENNFLKEQNKYVVEENVRLNNENTELRKRNAPPVPAPAVAPVADTPSSGPAAPVAAPDPVVSQ